MRHVNYANQAYNELAHWRPSCTRPGFWYLISSTPWIKTGYATVDNFGNLVPVPDTE